MHRTTRWTYLGLALVFLGLVAAGAGAATHVDERRCSTVQTVVVVPADEVAVGEDVPRRNFSELSKTERQVFKSALNQEGTVLTKRGVLGPMVVRYEGERYAVDVGREADACEPFDRERVLVPLVGGLVSFGVGTILVRGRDHPE